MVRHIMVPVSHMREKDGYLQTLRIRYNVPLPEGKPAETRSFKFADIDESDRIFDSVETKYPKLPARSLEWNLSSSTAWKSLQDPGHITLPDAITIKTPLKLKKTPCPVTKKNRNSWTAEQRIAADGAAVASSIPDLQERLKEIHKGGTAKPNSYVEVNTDILHG
ncbi:hypothetical protein B0H10DRAFT_2212689 [Mycena sp. CBHHK59/15]|nr:hypothetical protein B0H10DRAFT_2212689 [Mycena sp. CBHHK59/15]